MCINEIIKGMLLQQHFGCAARPAALEWPVPVGPGPIWMVGWAQIQLWSVTQSLCLLTHESCSLSAVGPALTRKVSAHWHA
jgi:hypothetical protein